MIVMLRRKLSAVGMGAALLLGLVAVPAPAQADPSCPFILFLGLRGAREGAVIHDDPTPSKADEDHWGATIDAVWAEFATRRPIAIAEAVPTRRGLADVLLGTEAFAHEAAGHLVDRLRRQIQNCNDQTNVVIASYSQGAWAVDIALRTLKRETPQVLPIIKGAFLMGDPVFPPREIDGVERQGLFTAHGRGYETEEEYRDHGIGSALESICMGPTPPVTDGWDPICSWDGKLATLATDIGNHWEYEISAAIAADFLASKVGAGVG
ncbi:hypothetical protein [Geodermatophilus sp. SYSU D01105]